MGARVPDDESARGAETQSTPFLAVFSAFHTEPFGTVQSIKTGGYHEENAL